MNDIIDYKSKEVIIDELFNMIGDILKYLNNNNLEEFNINQELIRI